MRDLEAALGTVVDGAPPVLDTLMPELRALLDTERVAAYGVAMGDEGCDVAFLHVDGFSPSLDITGSMQRWLGASRGRFGLYDAARAEHTQQNRVLTTPSYREILEGPVEAGHVDAPDAGREVQEAAGIFDLDQVRVLICDGPRLLAWVGGFQQDRPSSVQASRLRALIPALRRRLRLESRLGRGAVDTAALFALLERVAGAALVVSATGRVHLANSAGRARYNADPRGTLASIGSAIAGARGARFEATPLAIEGAPPCYLVTELAAPADPAPGVKAATRRYGLTPREADVLLHLAQGASNRVISLELECAEGTVAVHVAHLLDKLGVPSRAAAVARFWMDAAAT